jgi:hypothetical protein
MLATNARTGSLTWLCPKLPVVALQSTRWEEFGEADASAFSESPTIWLEKVASILKS